MSKVDWFSMTPQEQFEAIASAPPVAGPWEPVNDWYRRRRVYSQPDVLIGNVATAFRWTAPRTGFGCDLPNWCAADIRRAEFATVDEAKAAADAELVSQGWRLIG
jgi:hypothetical protein